jgi:hypothetical protein
MTITKGAVYIAFGEQAQKEAKKSVIALKRHNPKLPIYTLDNPAVLFEQSPLPSLVDASNMVLSRWAKVSLDLWSPFKQTLYIDADTRPRGNVLPGFVMLRDGWELILAPSTNQGCDLFWHLSAEERKQTFVDVSYQPLQLQAGVMFFRKNKAMERLFVAWRKEWLCWRNQDQGALSRALHRNPVRIWALGRPWNGGGVIRHLFGNCRGSR